MKKIIFVHGYEAFPEKDWFPFIAKELDALRVEYVIPRMPGDSYPWAKDWVEMLDKEVQSAGKPVILVGYSLGAQAALLYLEQYEPNNIDTVILIAAFNNDIQQHRMKDNEAYNSFFDHTIDMVKVKTLANRFIVMHSKDDPYAKYEWGVQTAETLNAKLITYEDRNHFYLPENYTYVLDVLKTVL